MKQIIDIELIAPDWMEKDYFEMFLHAAAKDYLITTLDDKNHRVKIEKVESNLSWVYELVDVVEELGPNKEKGNG